MNDDRLRDVLRRLPRPHASSDFTERVMQRLDGPPRRSPLGRPAIGMTVAAAVLATVALVLGVVARTEVPTTGTVPADQVADGTSAGEAGAKAARLRELRREHEALMRDLQALREQSRSPSPLLYLGGTDQLDVVVDLGRVGRTQSDDSSLARPASHQTRP